MFKKILIPTVLILLTYGFWVSPEFKEISAGVSIFLFGMLCLEEGFKAFSGGLLERILQRATNTLFKSISFGCIVTTIMQSSGLISVLAISFLGAGLINLFQGVGIILGANIGTTSGAWLMASLGLKVNISSYAMPMLVFFFFFIMQKKNKSLKGFGYVLMGIGFSFLGIHYMKQGFEAFQSSVDLTVYSATGIKGILLYLWIGIVATVAMQSSHATIFLVIAALSLGQISYENALMITIGANIGTTLTAVVISLGSNIDGKRLAASHFIFNLVTGVIAIMILDTMMLAIDKLSAFMGIAADNFTLKLALFDTVFKVFGVLMFLPFVGKLVSLLTVLFKATPSKEKHLERVLYLNEAVLELPTTSIVAITNETKHLYKVAFKIIANGLILKRRNILSDMNIDKVIQDEYTKEEVDVNREYLARVKDISGAILDFSTRAQMSMEKDQIKKIYDLKLANRYIVASIKATQHLCKNMKIYTKSNNQYVREEYNLIRKHLVELLRVIHKISISTNKEEVSALLAQAKLHAENNDIFANGTLDNLIRQGLIPNEIATSLMNDSTYMYEISQNLIAMAEVLFLNTLLDENDTLSSSASDHEMDEFLGKETLTPHISLSHG